MGNNKDNKTRVKLNYIIREYEVTLSEWNKCKFRVTFTVDKNNNEDVFRVHIVDEHVELESSTVEALLRLIIHDEILYKKYIENLLIKEIMR